jgi:hypothetical protein
MKSMSPIVTEKSSGRNDGSLLTASWFRGRCEKRFCTDIIVPLLESVKLECIIFVVLVV